MNSLIPALAGALSLAFASTAANAAETVPASLQAAPAPDLKKAKKPTKGKTVREKDFEGSQAPNRFEADTVIKSQYEYKGQPLEVDPD